MKSRLVLIACFFILSHLSCNHATENETPPFVPPYPALPAIKISWTDQNSIVCFGTSLTYGYGAGDRNPFCKTEAPIVPTGTSSYKPRYIRFTTDQILALTKSHQTTMNSFYKATGICNACVGDSSYPRFLQEYLKIKVYNQGYTAARIQTGLDVLRDSVLSKNPVLVLLEFGANEFLQKVSIPEADSLLILLIQRIITAGPNIVLVSFIHPDMVTYSGNSWTSADSVRALAYYAMMDSIASYNALPFISYPFKGIYGHPELMSDELHPNGAGYKKWAENVFYALIETFKSNNMIK